MEKENRVDWVDVLKGIAIIWLIIYHFYVFDWMYSPVPVFFFLSGLFFSEGKSFVPFISKKARALLIPFIFFFVLGLVASALGHILIGELYSFPPLRQFTSLIPITADNANPLGVGAIWFLVSLFEIYIIYYLLRLVSKNRYWLLTTGSLLFLLSCITMQHYAMGSLFYLLYTFGYCIFFFIAHQFRGYILSGEIPIWVLLIAVMVYSIKYIVDPVILNDDRYEGWGGFSMVIWFVSMFGLLFMLIWLCKKISSIKEVLGLKLYRFILFEGRNSLTILGIHLLVMSVASIILNRILSEGCSYYTILFLIIIIVCNICIVFFNRYVPFLVNHK